MSEIKDGGPAFPVADSTGFHHGLSRREWFAGMAMQGMIAALTKFKDPHSGIIVNRPKDISELAFRYADSMIQEAEGSK